jgi:hypothetical protein
MCHVKTHVIILVPERVAQFGGTVVSKKFIAALKNTQQLGPIMCGEDMQRSSRLLGYVPQVEWDNCISTF